MGHEVKEYNIQKVIVQYLRAHNYTTIDTDIPNALRFFKSQGQRLAYISERKVWGERKGDIRFDCHRTRRYLVY